MVLRRLARLFLIMLLGGGIVLTAGEAALACTCGADPIPPLAQSDAAFVGRLIAVGEPQPDPEGIVSSAELVRWTFEVEQVVKGDVQSPLSVLSPWHEASCGFEIALGERIGVVLASDEGGEWHGGRCGQVDPGALLAQMPPARLGDQTPTGTIVDGPRTTTTMATSSSTTQVHAIDTPDEDNVQRRNVPWSLVGGALAIAAVGALGWRRRSRHTRTDSHNI